MNRAVLDHLERRMHDERRSDYRGDDERRRRSSRTGRYMRDRRDYEDERDYRDYEDERDYRDYEDRDYGRKEMRLNKADINHWKKKLQNTDGTKGEHYDFHQVMQCADKLGIKFNEFDEKEFCLMVNVMYSDYGHTIRKYVPVEKELMFCAEMAKAFLDDPDGPEPSEKVALYYHCIASYEEV